MIIEAWPFLVSRNTYLDYRTVIAPDFICDAGISSLLARVAEGELTKPNELIVRKIVNTKSGDFTIVFQVVIAKEKDIYSEGGNKELVDQFGREIYLFNGIFINGIGDDFVYISEKDIEIAYEKSVEAYREFWNLVKPESAILSSQFSIEKINTDQALSYIEKPIFNVAAQNKKSSSRKSLALKLLFSKVFSEEIRSIAFSPISTSIVVQDKGLKTVIWNYDLSKHKPDEVVPGLINFRPIPSEHSVCFSPDGKLLAVSRIRDSDQNLIELYNLQLRKRDKTFRGHKISQWGRVTSIAFDPKGDFLASSSRDKSVKIWSVFTEKGSAPKHLSHDDSVLAIAISPDSCRLASGDNSGNIIVWNLETYEKELLIPTALSLINSIAFSPDGKLLVAAGKNRYDDFVDCRRLQAWNLSNECKQDIFISAEDLHSDVINSVAFSPDGKILASAGKDKKIIFWSVNTIEGISPLFLPQVNAHDDEITSIAFSPKGNYLASGSKDKVVNIWSF